MQSDLRLAASSYSNTAPLIWSFLYGSNRGQVEMILDNAPARSFELLNAGRVNAAIVPVIASQFIDNIKIIPNVCVGAEQSVRSVCLITDGKDINTARTVALDISSKTSVFLTKIMFREFLKSEPQWIASEPDIEKMLMDADAALLIGDPAFTIDREKYRVFDLVELWREYTGFGFVFAMWMTQERQIEIDFAAARAEGLAHINEIANNYCSSLNVAPVAMIDYLTKNISYSVSDEMRNGLELYIKLAGKCGLIEKVRPLNFNGSQ